MAKTIQEKLLQNPTAICLSAKEEHNHSKLAVKIANAQQPIKPLTLDKNIQFESQIKSREQQRKVTYILRYPFR